MNVVAQKLGVVVDHLFEVRHHPAFVHAVAMKAAGKLIVDATAGHLFEGRGEGLACPVIAAVHCYVLEQVERGGMRELGL